MTKPLSGHVALVAGATRGAGRGIAIALGEAGATVYCSGRSSRKNKKRSRKRPETIEGTAEMVTAAGGEGIAVRTDHSDRKAVKALAARIAKEQRGRLDILVNDIWGGDELMQWGKPLWKLDLDQGFRMFEQAVYTHLITSHVFLPMMVKRKRGLVLEITDGDGLSYRGELFYDLVKTTVIRLAFAQSEDLRPHGVAAIAVTPGFLRSEHVLDHFKVTEASWRDAGKKDHHFLQSESPRFVGRGIAALAAAPDLMARSGNVYSSWALAREFGFTDADGERPDFGKHMAKDPVFQEYDKSHDAFLAKFAARAR